MLNDLKSLNNLLNLFDSAYTEGITLEHFTDDSDFNQSFLDVYYHLINGSVPIKPCAEYGVTNVIRDSSKHNPSKLFEICLRNSMDLFKEDGEFTPLQKNRNITIYKGILIHEIAHILEGSFEPVNLETILEDLGNHEFGHDLFNIMEDYRIEQNITHKFRNSHPEYKTALNFLNMNLIGVKHSYMESDLEDVLNTYICKIKTGHSLTEILSAENESYTNKEELSKVRLQRNETYKTIEEAVQAENTFYSKETNEELKKLGINNYKELVDTLVEKTKTLYLKSYVESVELLPEIYELLDLQFKILPSEKDKNKNKNNSSKSQDQNNEGGGNIPFQGETQDNSSKNNQSKNNQKNNSSQNNQKNNSYDNSSKGTKYNPSKTNKSISSNDDFTQGSWKPDSMDEFKKNKDNIKSRIEQVAEALSDAYKNAKEKQQEKDLEKQNKNDFNSSMTLMEYNENNIKARPTEVIWETLKSNDDSLANRIRISYSRISNAITQQFDELKLNQIQLLANQKIGSTFNPASLVYALSDVNFAREGRLYDNTLMNKKDYSIYYLIDASGSTKETISSREKSPITGKQMTVLDIEKIAVASAYQGIENLGLHDDFHQKIFLFNSNYNTIIYHAKNVNELSAVESGAGNRDGAAIRALTKRIETEPNQDKILFLFADGLPAYANGVFDTSMAIKEATDKGIKVFYILTSNDAKLNRNAELDYPIITKYATDKKVIFHPSMLPKATKSMIEEHLI
ncbi:MAG: hypothetical protein AB7V77_01130 [Candidatus Woesearchaeota archaeon]